MSIKTELSVENMNALFSSKETDKLREMYLNLKDSNKDVEEDLRREMYMNNFKVTKGNTSSSVNREDGKLVQHLKFVTNKPKKRKVTKKA